MQEAISLWLKGDIYYNGIIGYKPSQTFFQSGWKLVYPKSCILDSIFKLVTEIFVALGGAAMGVPVSFPLTSEKTPHWSHLCSCCLHKFSRIFRISQILSFYTHPDAVFHHHLTTTLRRNKTGRKESDFWCREARIHFHLKGHPCFFSTFQNTLDSSSRDWFRKISCKFLSRSPASVGHLCLTL